MGVIVLWRFSVTVIILWSIRIIVLTKGPMSCCIKISTPPFGAMWFVHSCMCLSQSLMMWLCYCAQFLVGVVARYVRSRIAAMCILRWLSCCVMSNCVSFPLKLSGLIDAMMIVCTPSFCPSSVSLCHWLKMDFRFSSCMPFSCLYFLLFRRILRVWFQFLWRCS